MKVGFNTAAAAYTSALKRTADVVGETGPAAKAGRAGFTLTPKRAASV